MLSKWKQSKKIAALTSVIVSISYSIAHSEIRMVKMSSGTGFFVDERYFITNNHVIQNCADKITVHGPMEAEAEVVATEPKLDLALLKTNKTSPYISTLRFNDQALAVGDKLILLGYPKNSGFEGQYKIVDSKIKGLKGPTGQEQWIQFEDAAQHGNSGGPLLDQSGYVIGVIMGKTALYELDPITKQRKAEAIYKSDIAISLHVVKAFLEKAKIHYNRAASMAQRSRMVIEKDAREYTINVRCAVKDGV